MYEEKTMILNETLRDTSEKPLTPTMEDYMEAIFELSKEKRNVRVKDIAKRLAVKMPTVTNMLKTLSKSGLVEYEKYEYLELTEKGTRIGKEMRRRHKVLRNFLNKILKIDLNTADEEACRMEHAVSAGTLDSLVDLMEFLEVCPRAGAGFLKYFEEYRVHGQDREKCLERMRAFASKFEDEMDRLEESEEKAEQPSSRHEDGRMRQLL
jgi:DtxR family Mn-dependent transcriptional regulator